MISIDPLAHKGGGSKPSISLDGSKIAFISILLRWYQMITIGFGIFFMGEK